MLASICLNFQSNCESCLLFLLQLFPVFHWPAVHVYEPGSLPRCISNTISILRVWCCAKTVGTNTSICCQKGAWARCFCSATLLRSLCGTFITACTYRSMLILGMASNNISVITDTLHEHQHSQIVDCHFGNQVRKFWHAGVSNTLTLLVQSVK